MATWPSASTRHLAKSGFGGMKLTGTSIGPRVLVWMATWSSRAIGISSNPRARVASPPTVPAAHCQRPCNCTFQSRVHTGRLDGLVIRLDEHVRQRPIRWIGRARYGFVVLDRFCCRKRNFCRHFNRNRRCLHGAHHLYSLEEGHATHQAQQKQDQQGNGRKGAQLPAPSQVTVGQPIQESVQKLFQLFLR